MKRAGFTMIELIFVIVILGILAAVAIPKLAATRTDAEIAKMATNAATIVSDYGAGYTARGDFNSSTLWFDVTNTPTVVTSTGAATVDTTTLAAPVSLADGTNLCVTFTASDGNLSVSNASGGGNVCGAVVTKIANLIKVHSFGGTGIQ